VITLRDRLYKHSRGTLTALRSALIITKFRALLEVFVAFSNKSILEKNVSDKSCRMLNDLSDLISLTFDGGHQG